MIKDIIVKEDKVSFIVETNLDGVIVTKHVTLSRDIAVEYLKSHGIDLFEITSEDSSDKEIACHKV